MCWMADRSQIREAIVKHRAYHTALQKLRYNMVAVKAELKEFKITYMVLKENMKG